MVEPDMQDSAEHPLDGAFEPEAKDITSSQADAALVSIAVSLKRIADVIEPLSIRVEGVGGFSGFNNMMWQLGQTFGRAIETGRR